MGFDNFIICNFCGNNLNYMLRTEVSFQWAVEKMKGEEVKILSRNFE